MCEDFHCLCLFSVFTLGVIGCDSSTNKPVSSSIAGILPKAFGERPTGEMVDSAKIKKDAQLAGKPHRFERFAFSLPDRFKLFEIPVEASQPDVKMAVYKSMLGEDETEAIVSITQLSAEEAIADATKNLGQFLVNFSAGTANGMGLKIVNRSKQVAFEWNGLGGTKMPLLFKLPNQQHAGGMIYGLIHENSVLAILHISLQGEPEKVMNEMDLHLSTLRFQ